jgi:hypothetical protein
MGRIILVLSLHTSLDAKHLLERVFVSVLHFECLPLLPEGGVGPRIAELGRMTVNRTRPINLTKSAFHLSKLETHLLGLLIWQSCDSPLVDWSRRSEAEVGG